MPLAKFRNLLRRSPARRGEVTVSFEIPGQQSPALVERNAIGFDEEDGDVNSASVTQSLTDQDAHLLAEFAAHLPSLGKASVLDLGSPLGRVGVQVLKRYEESAVTFVHPSWDRVTDALISVGEELRRQPGQRSRMTYHVSQLAALDAAFVSSHLYLTWVSAGEPLDDAGEDAESTGSTRIRSSIEVLLGWYAALARNNPQIQTRLLLGVADGDAGTLAALASLHGLEVASFQICPGSVAVFELRHRFMESTRGTAEMQAVAA